MATNPSGLNSSSILTGIFGTPNPSSVTPGLDASLGLGIALGQTVGVNDVVSLTANPFSLGGAPAPATGSLSDLLSGMLGQNSIYSILGNQNPMPFLGGSIGAILGNSSGLLAGLLGPNGLSSGLVNIIGSIFNMGANPVVDRLLPGIFSGGGGGLFGGGGLLNAIAGSAVQMKGTRPLILSSLLGSSVGRADLFGGTSSVISGLFNSFGARPAAPPPPANPPAA